MIKRFFNYSVSDDGHVYLANGREVSYQTGQSGLIQCHCKIPVTWKWTLSVAEIVYATFNENCPADFWDNRSKYRIYHRDGNHTNNHVDNIMCCYRGTKEEVINKKE